MTKINTIIFDHDIVEIHHNENLKYRPYLLRLINYNNETYELRLEAENLKEFSELLNNIYESQNI